MYKKINEKSWELFLGILLLSFYGVLFYLMLSSESTLDFLSFYSSFHTLLQGENPYQILSTAYLSTAKTVAANLNPPILLLLLCPFSYLNFYNALVLWSLLSLVLGLIGARIAFNYAFPPSYIKKNGFYLYFIYLLSFPTIMNIGLAQLGSWLLFFIMSGYYFYIKKNDYYAGILWGIIISIKFFPALLFIFALMQKRYKVCVVMVSVFLLLSLIPIAIYGVNIYTQYFSMVSDVKWYGKSWNASLLGIIFRLFADTASPDRNWLFIKLLYSILSCFTLILYLFKVNAIERHEVVHQSFCFTLVMMLLLSPLGWLYYFPLLVFPIALTWQMILDKKQQGGSVKMVWFLCLFCIFIPINNISLINMNSLIDKLAFYSFNFYGLLLLLYLVGKIKNPIQQ